MIISCKCLNVLINTKNTDLQFVDNPQLQLDLSGLEQIDPFFKENICTVELIRISKEQGSLVQVHNVGNWVIHRCLNCSINTHAVHRDRGAACVLVNGAMLTNPAEITALKASAKYSQVFHLVVNSVDCDLSSLQAQAKCTAGSTKAALVAIQTQLADAIQQEVTRTEEKIRSFSEQHYALLEEFSVKAHNDHRALMQTLCNADDNNKSTPMTHIFRESSPTANNDRHIPPPQLISTSVPRLPFSLNAAIPLSPVPILGNVISSPIRKQLSSGEPVKSTNSPTLISNMVGSNKTERNVKTRLFSETSSAKKTEGSLDAEGLFDLEGMDDTPTEVFHSEEETEEDTDDSASHDEGIHIPRSRSTNFNLAKSLPVNVPIFLSAHTRAEEQDDDRNRPQDPMDIAASIKALARSVHGDAVFGELPRPRFSTQI